MWMMLMVGLFDLFPDTFYFIILLLMILSWNCQWAKNTLFIGALSTLIQLDSPHVIALFEPRISGEKADRVIRQIGYPNSHRLEAVGFSGGIWLFWDNVWKVKVIDTKHQFMHCRISINRESEIMFTAIYGHPAASHRARLWHQLSDLQNDIVESWLLMGDFNSIISGSKRTGAAVNRVGVCNRFVDWLIDSGIIDLGFLGPRFT